MSPKWVLLFIAVSLVACRGLKETNWVNPNYDPASLRDRFTSDTAQCKTEAQNANPFPQPIYGSCSGGVTAEMGIREGVYVDQSSSGRFDGNMSHGDIIGGPNNRSSSACSVDLIMAIDEKITEKQKAETNRRKYLQSCLNALGWKQQEISNP